MTEQTNRALSESISALVDGEASEMDLQRVLKGVEHDDAARDTWRRYNLMSAALRGELANIGDQDSSMTDFAKVDLSAGISALIEQEDAHSDASANQAKPKPSVASWQGALGKTAIAASVALAFVVGFQNLGTEPNAGGEIAELAPAATESIQNTAEAAAPEWFVQPELRTRTVSSDGQILPSTANSQRSATFNSINLPVNEQPSPVRPSDERINRLLFKHAEQSSSSAAMSVVPLTRAPKLDEHKD
ncbi:MAG: anti-sigma factor [Alteromonadaceae bacterium]|nr:MAG: anti-sigma factor [Alteromonadaceae bacterium]